MRIPVIVPSNKIPTDPIVEMMEAFHFRLTERLAFGRSPAATARIPFESERDEEDCLFIHICHFRISFYNDLLKPFGVDAVQVLGIVHVLSLS